MKHFRITIGFCLALLLAISPAFAGISASLTNTQLRATPVPVSGTVTASGPLTDAQLRATPVPVSGTVTASGPLTDAQLRATPVPVSGPLTNTEIRAAVLPVYAQPQTTGGLSVYHRVAVANGNEFVVKSSPGQVFGVSVFNRAATASKISFYNTSSLPTRGTTAILMAVNVPSGQSYVAFNDFGIAFSTGISVSVEDVGTNLQDTNVANVAVDEVTFDVFYK